MTGWTARFPGISAGILFAGVLAAIPGCGTTQHGNSPAVDTNRGTANSLSLSEAIGQTDALAVPEGVDQAVFQQLQDELVRVMQEQGQDRFVSEAPHSQFSAVSDLAIRHNADGSADLDWSYRNQGDGDLNSEVNIADLTPIGVHLKRRFGSPEWPRARNTDNDLNTEVNISDVTPIGVYLLNTVSGYWLQLAESEQGPWQNVVQTPFSSSAISSETFRREFSFHIDMPVDGNYYRVSPYHGGDIGIPSNHVKVDSFVLPGKPENGIATQGTIKDAVDLAWDAVADVQFYEIQRRTGELGAYEFLSDTPDSTTTFTDDNVAEGEHYSYIVRGWKDYKKTDFSDQFEGWPMETPLAPEKLVASDGTSADSISLQWEAVGNADEYVLYHALEETGTFSEIARTSQLEYVDSAAVAAMQNWYYVTAVNQAGESAPSNTDSGYMLGALPYVESVSPLYGFKGTAVQMAAVTAGPAVLGWSWDFGGAASPAGSSEQSPLITLGEPGTYSCSLTLQGSFDSTQYNFEFEVQGYEWSHHLGSPDPDTPYNIAADSAGNVYIIGRVAAGPFVAKLDRGGKLMWAKHFYTSLDSQWISGSVTGDGDVYVATALARGYNDAPSSTGVLNFKIDTNGVLQFALNFDDGDPELLCHHPRTAVGADGRFCVAFSSANASYGDVHLVTYVLSASGNMEWLGYYETPAEFVHGRSVVDAVLLDGSGNVYLTGDEAHVAKLDPVGDVLWCKGWGDTSQAPHEHGYCVRVDISGNVYLSGGADYSEELGYQPFLIKFDPGGNILWQRSFSTGPEQITNGTIRFQLDSSGNAYCLNPQKDDKDIPSCFYIVDPAGSLTGAWSYTGTIFNNKLVDIGYLDGRIQLIGETQEFNGTWQTASMSILEHSKVLDDRTLTRVAEAGSLVDISIGSNLIDYVGEIDVPAGHYDLIMISKEISSLPQ
ncbi:SBBP repeat-containing protein [bacterium]|nr:SBBP repeat-containing protein [bacterium]